MYIGYRSGFLNKAGVSSEISSSVPSGEKISEGEITNEALSLENLYGIMVVNTLSQ